MTSFPSRNVSTAALAASVAVAHVSNLSPLANWQAAIRSVINGEGHARLSLVTDSNGFGYLLGNGTNYQESRPWALAERVVHYLNEAGIPAQCDNLIGNGNVGLNSTTIYQYDSRVTGSGWVVDNGSAYGGANLRSNSQTNPLSFTPAGEFDTIELYYATIGGAGAGTVNVDGGASLGSFDCNASGDVKKLVVTCSLGNHTVNVVPNNTAQIYVSGIVCFDSTVPSVIVETGGGAGMVEGSGTGGMVGGNYKTEKVIAAKTPSDLTILAMMTNAVNSSTAAATTLTNTATLLRWLGQAGSDLAIVIPARSSTGETLFNDTRSALVSLAGGGIPVIDLPSVFGTYAEANTAGYMVDTVHLSRAGVNIFAQKIVEVLRAVA